MTLPATVYAAGPVPIEVQAESTEVVSVQLDGVDIGELAPAGGGLFVGALPVRGAVDDGSHDVEVIATHGPYKDSRSASFEVSTPEPGTMAWFKAGPAGSRTNRVALTPEGDTLEAGQVEVNKVKRPSLRKRSGVTGAEIWSVELDTREGTVADLAVLPDGRIWLAMNVRKVGDPSPQPRIALFDADGEPTGVEALGDLGQGVRGIAADAEGGCFAGGYAPAGSDLDIAFWRINGVTANGPNEAQTPDPYGNPVFGMPDVAGDFDQTAFLDLCGGHSGGSMHYHGLNEACFEQAADGTPANSYATASQAWDLVNMLTGACTEPSGVIGWSLDGYPIQGPCVCTARDGETCTEVKRVRSAWVYDGLGGWGADPGEEDALAVEGVECVDDNVCCPGGGAGCDFRCAPVLRSNDEPDGSNVEHRCALLDFAWCTHRYVDRSLHAGGDFVYLDRCNGYEGPDGYAYHATASFPYINGCYRGVPNLAPMGGLMMGEGGDPPKCEPGQMMCCDDGICGGPETADNCPEDC